MRTRSDVGRAASAAELDGTIVLVTGAGGDIGREVCARLAMAGATLVAIDRSASDLARLTTDLAAQDLTAQVAVLDLSDWPATADFAARVVADHGRVDVLVNLAGRFAVGEFLSLGPDDWTDVVSANLGTAVSATAAVLPHMRSSGSGVVVNVASSAGEQGAMGKASAYAAAKGAVIALTKSLAREFLGDGIRVNCVSPGPIDSRALRSAPAGGSIPGSAAIHGRVGLPEDVAEAVAFLAGSRSSYITGEVLRVNGGLLI